MKDKARGEVTGQKISEPLLCRIPDACQMLACSRSHLYELMDAGLIQSVKDGKSRKPVVASIHAYVHNLLTAKVAA